MADLRVDPVSTKAELAAFIELPWQVYLGDPCWVPPLLSERREFFDRRRNPFFEYGRAEYFLARRGDQIVGRIAAIINPHHNDFHQEQVGFFGAFEALEDPDAAAALLHSASDWVRTQGMTAIRGPATFSINDECGLLVDGFDSPPVIMTTYNPLRYVGYIEQAGFKKAMDLYAYTLPQDKLAPEALNPKLARVVERVKQRPGVRLRAAKMRNYWQEAEFIKRLYNAAWTKNWGFVPLTDTEFDHLARKMRQIIDPDLVFFVEMDGETVGFALNLPDVNQVLRLAYPNPRTPEWLSLAKLLWHWKVRSKITTVRLFALGVKEDARLTGIDALLYYETAKVALAKGYRRGDMSWLLETNTMVNRSVRMMGAEIYKAWRLYERELPKQPRF